MQNFLLSWFFAVLFCQVVQKESVEVLDPNGRPIFSMTPGPGAEVTFTDQFGNVSSAQGPELKIETDTFYDRKDIQIIVYIMLGLIGTGTLFALLLSIDKLEKVMRKIWNRW